HQWDRDGVAWEGFGSTKGALIGAGEHGEKQHDYGDRDHSGFAYGSKGATDGFSKFAKQIADGHIADALEAGEHSLTGAEGHKKYSYFTQGSGPNGFYSKGYWGTNGYDHEAAKKAHVKNANHGGFRKGYEHAGADHGLAHSAWDKVAGGKDIEGKAYDNGAWQEAAKQWGNTDHEDGWKGYYDEKLHDYHHRNEDWD
ncbi:unnamed protein product, partial [Thelazia callipaeda]|uniref:PE_PGRS family protein n=1 Tax=Thelazia callipaeda TaxID=103827 RepID=A0A0N5CTK2_THECL